MSEPSQATKNLINRYQFWYQALQPKAEMPTIHVDEVASTIASFYEKIRGVVEWKEEHLLRRAAIGRILKRRMFLQKTGEEIAEPFVFELIRSGHFPNDRIEETKIEEVKKALNKYLFILQNSPGPQQEKGKVQLYDWLLNLAACEIEEILCSPIREKALIEYMTELMEEKIEVGKENKFSSSPSSLSRDSVTKGSIIQKMMGKEEKETQVYVACQRALFKLDGPIISYYLLRKRYPAWSDLPRAQLQGLAFDIYSIWKDIERDLNHPLAEKFYKICEKYDTPYLILGDILSQSPPEARENFDKPEVLEGLIKSAYQARLRKLKARMGRAAVFSTISIFATKMLLAFAIEIPFDRYVLGEFNRQSLIFNILIPPLLMFLLVLTIRPPKKENLDRVILEAMKIVYEKDKKDIYTIKPPRKKGFILNFIVFTFYSLTFIVSFGLIILGLKRLDFGALSIIIFLMFFSLIAFAGVKIRERAKELDITEGRGGFLAFLADTISLPFLRVGRWLSSQWLRFNIVVVLITALIDMPFQLFTEFLEHWRTFLKEKKDEIH